ncbi:MAG: VOC family protein [Flavobacteriales bacterium]|nr:VOC family protein [Flavobacteriales bacterium]
MNPVVHFEMPAEDRKRLSKFYSSVFGWKMQEMGPEMGDYVVAHTAETDADHMVKTPGAINGGFFMKSADQPNIPSVVIAVDDVNEQMKKVTAAGGKVIGEPQEIPGIGLWVVFIDSEGNRVSMMQPLRK